VKTHRIVERVGKILPSYSHGVGNGESRDLYVRLRGLRIGPYEIDRPILALSTDTEGSLSNADLGVNLGGNILSRFTVIIDYPGRRLILEPNSRFQEPFASDASGLVLKAQGADFKTFTVDGVVPNSPATGAGLQVGDIITAINGLPVRKYALWELQDEFKKSGQVYELKVKRGDTLLNRRLKLRSLL
jgi:membrane-associated protease RseP (regulator of RpoE activity)